MFLGEYHHSLDTKGRIAFPAKFRNEVTGNMVYVSRYKEGSLAIYSPEGWRKQYDALMALNQNKAEVRKYIRAILSKTFEVPIDDHGRILVPETLIKIEDLKRDCVFVGQGEHAELWSEDKWNAYEDDISEEELAAISETL